MGISATEPELWQVVLAICWWEADGEADALELIEKLTDAVPVEPYICESSDGEDGCSGSFTFTFVVSDDENADSLAARLRLDADYADRPDVQVSVRPWPCAPAPPI
jgi:hypothetical protein